MRIEEVSERKDTSSVKYKELHSEKLGKYLVAAKKLSAGEVILRDKPVVVGPASFNENYLCFECMRVIPTAVSDTFSCVKCKIAIFCCAACEIKNDNHTTEECDIFQDKMIEPLEMASLLLPLRLWLHRGNEELWSKILQLEDHHEARKHTAIWKDRQENVINVLQSFGLIGESAELSNDVLQRLCGILDVNSFELRSPGSFDSSALRGLYLKASLMAHDCRGNTHLTVDDDFQLTVYASRLIEEGESLLFNYTASLLGTAERRDYLREGKYFICDCPMCKDPEELGSNLSTIICPRCRTGSVLFQGAFDVDPYVNERNWKCAKCQRLFSGGLIKTSLELVKRRIDQLHNPSTKELEILLKQLSFTLHPNHFLMLNLKQKLLAICRSEVACLNPPKKMLSRMVELCTEILQVLEIVEPGISRLKGIILYEVHLPMVILANKKYTARDINLEKLIEELEKAEECLKKSLTMLLLEPVSTPEGSLAKRALQEYKALRDNLKDVKSLPLCQAEKPINPRVHK